MPELPDLEVISRFLAPRLPGVAIAAADVLRPLIVRDLIGSDPSSDLAGLRFAAVTRRGKFLVLRFTDGSMLVINPMLAGRLRYGSPLGRNRTRDALVLRLEDGHELRYNDQAGMGKIYLTPDLALVPTFAEQGPEATDPALTLELFRDRLRRHPGEIKGILTNQGFVAGIGNAYADEICWSAQLYPFRKRFSLKPDEAERLYTAMRTVLAEAIDVLSVRVGDQIDVEIRDFLAIHGKAGRPCPRCGATISEVTRERRATHFCRTCQPGLMVGGGTA